MGPPAAATPHDPGPRPDDRQVTRRRVGAAVLVAAVVVGVVSVAGLNRSGAMAEGGPDRASAGSPPGQAPSSTTSTTAAAPETQTPGIPVPDVVTHPAGLGDLHKVRDPAPVALRIGALGVDAPVGGVGIATDGTGELDVPARADAVVWYQFGPSPGAPGSAVLAGHVDYNGARGVFFRLTELNPGTPITVGYDDGSRRQFTVTTRRQFAKPELPAGEIFTRDGPAHLTLVTCGGSFDRAAGSYRDNVVVQAVPVGS